MLKELFTLFKYSSIFAIANIIYVLNFGFMLKPYIVSNLILFFFALLAFNTFPCSQLGNIMKLTYSEINKVNIIRHITIKNLGFTSLCFGVMITTTSLTIKFKEYFLPEIEQNPLTGTSLDPQVLITIFGLTLISIGLVTFIALYFKIEKQITKSIENKTLCEIEDINQKCAFLIKNIGNKKTQDNESLPLESRIDKTSQKILNDVIQKYQKTVKRATPNQNRIDAISKKRERRKKQIADCLKQKEKTLNPISQDEALAKFS